MIFSPRGIIAAALGALSFVGSLHAQPSFEGSLPSREVIEDSAERRAAYLARIDEVNDWHIDLASSPGSEVKLTFSTISMLLQRGEQIERCNRRMLELMDPEMVRSGPFWMFPVVIAAHAGRDVLSAEASASIREAFRFKRQLRGDTENHWMMYYVSLYLMSELYPNEPGESWYTGKSSEENLAETRGWLIDWMDITTSIGQGEYNATHYVSEYAIPMLMLATYSSDPEMKQRGKMVLDWLFAELANVTLEGVLRGPNSRVGDTAVVERGRTSASFLAWLLFGNTPPQPAHGGWPVYFATMAKHYHVPEVIYRLATDRSEDILQRDRARTRRYWRYSDQHMPPIYKTQYLRNDYAVGSHQGRISDPIQSHVWDVTWREDDPRGKHPTMFSLHPHDSGKVMQMFFAAYPDSVTGGLLAAGKPSYVEPDKLVGSSPYEKVFQDLDTVIALYDIPAGTDHERVNGFFSKDLRDLIEHESGWIFARGGDAYLAYRPLADYSWTPHLIYRGVPATPGQGYSYERDPTGSQVLVSPHAKNGTILQAASVAEFASYEAFQQAMIALPLEFSLEPTPTVTMTTLRGKQVSVTFGEAPIVDGTPLDYTQWKLFEGTHLNAEIGGRKLTITHGQLQRVLDFNTLTISDTVTSGK